MVGFATSKHSKTEPTPKGIQQARAIGPNSTQPITPACCSKVSIVSKKMDHDTFDSQTSEKLSHITVGDKSPAAFTSLPNHRASTPENYRQNAQSCRPLLHQVPPATGRLTEGGPNSPTPYDSAGCFSLYSGECHHVPTGCLMGLLTMQWKQRS